MQGIELIFSVVILIMSVVIHEVSHGFAAGLLGDPTAKYEGRLTLNPLKHLEFFGSFLLPVVTYMTAGIAFGWAKPVPYNPYNLKNQRWGELLVAIAGPASNILLALVFGLIIRFGGLTIPTDALQLLALIVFVNLGLAIFNMVPIPPLDGSKVLFAFIPYRFMHIRRRLEQYSFILVIVFVLFFSKYLEIPVFYLFKLIVGA